MVRTIVRVAWEDQYPKHFTRNQLRTAARDSVIRYARHYGLEFRWYHDMWGERWVRADGPDGPRMVPVQVYGYRSEAIVLTPKGPVLD